MKLFIQKKCLLCQFNANVKKRKRKLKKWNFKLKPEEWADFRDN